MLYKLKNAHKLYGKKGRIISSKIFKVVPKEDQKLFFPVQRFEHTIALNEEHGDDIPNWDAVFEEQDF